jgi:hypothetical protein
MRRRAIIFGIFAQRAIAEPEQRSFDEQRSSAVAFDLHWNLYIRRLFGCPDAGDTNAETCNPAIGQTDYKEFAKARDQAKRLFDLKD